MARRSVSSPGSRYAMAAEASREARGNRLRRAGWQPGEPYPGVDEQSGSPQMPAAAYTYDWSTGTVVGTETVTRSGTATHFTYDGFRQVVGQNTARIDYSGEDPNSILGIMVERASENLALNYNTASGSGWYGSNTIVANNGGIGADGQNSLDTVTATTTTPALAVYTDIPLNSDVSLTWLVKAGTASWARFIILDVPGYIDGKSLWVDLSTATLGSVPVGGTNISGISATARMLSTGIVETRISFQTEGIDGVEVQVAQVQSDVDYDSVVGATLLFDSIQVELGSPATSIIPTASLAVSRGLETVTVPVETGVYDVLIQDADGFEWRDATSVAGDSYPLSPRAGQRHVLRVLFYAAGVLSEAQKQALSGNIPPSMPPRPADFSSDFSTEFN